MSNTSADTQDRSLILRFTEKTLFSALLKRIPIAVKPNTITLVGFLSVLVCSFCTFLSNRTFKSGYFISGLALLLYLVADNLDGMHARNTKQTSRLGGFLDQWLDGISFLIITMSVLSSFRVTGFLYVAIVLLMAFINILLYHEQHQSGFFFKPAFGPNEFLLLMALVYFVLFTCYKNPAFVYQRHTFNSASIAVYVTLAFGILYVSRGLIMSKMTLQNFIIPFLSHSAASVPYFLHQSTSPLMIGILIILINAFFIGKILLEIHTITINRQVLLSLLLLSPFFLRIPTRRVAEVSPFNKKRDG